MPIKIRLPNGYGSIRKLSGKRTRTFAVFASQVKILLKKEIRNITSL